MDKDNEIYVKNCITNKEHDSTECNISFVFFVLCCVYVNVSACGLCFSGH